MAPAVAAGRPTVQQREGNSMHRPKRASIRRSLHAAAIILGAGFTLAPAFGADAILGPDWTPPIVEEGDPIPATAEGAAAQALRSGKVAPNPVFTDNKGEKVDLATLLEDGPIVLIFYRGGWCPYCVKQLKEFEEAGDAIREAGGRVIAVSPELPEFAAQTRSKNELTFPVLSDPNAVAARAFGVAWANERYGRVRSIAQHNGNEKGEIPLGVTYVIDTDGNVRWAFLEHDYKKRATPEQAIEALNSID
jgi:peroxiredoxin